MSIEQLREFRIGPYAVFDFAVSYLGILLLSPLLIWVFRKVGIRTNRAQWMYLVLPLAVVFHVVTGKDTPMNERLFDPNDYYALKLLMGWMLWRVWVVRERVE